MDGHGVQVIEIAAVQSCSAFGCVCFGSVFEGLLGLVSKETLVGVTFGAEKAMCDKIGFSGNSCFQVFENGLVFCERIPMNVGVVTNERLGGEGACG